MFGSTCWKARPLHYFGGLNVFHGIWTCYTRSSDVEFHQITKLLSFRYLDGHKDAATVLTEQNKTDDNDSALIAMRDQVEVMQILNSNYSTKPEVCYIRILKRSLATNLILRLMMVPKCSRCWCYGGKLCGAGGGVFFYCPRKFTMNTKHLSDLKGASVSTRCSALFKSIETHFKIKIDVQLIV